MSDPASNGQTDYVVDKAESRWSDLWKTEDCWAIWLGLFLLFVGLVVYLPNPPAGLDSKIAEASAVLEKESKRAPFRTLAWFEADDAKSALKATGEPYAKTIKQWTGKPHKWSDNPLDAFFLSEERAKTKAALGKKKYEALKAESETLKAAAQQAEQSAGSAGFNDAALNAQAKDAIQKYRDHLRNVAAAKKKTKAKAYNQIPYLLATGLAIALLFALGMQVMNGNGLAFLKGFAFIFMLAVLAFFFAAQADIKSLGIGYAAWAILLGLLISNTLGTPEWVKPAVQVEYFIKTGLVLLGAEILFSKVLTIGLPGLFVAWVVTPVVLITTYWFGQRVLKIESKTLNMTISADMSVCGVSAAIATAAACRAKKEELTLAVGLSLVFTSVMMVVMPNIILAFGMDHVLGGAWMGGTIDATGAVAAAGAFLSDRALYVAATVKMIQNILIGVIAFCVALYWVTKVERDPARPRPGLMEIWHRFPKFVIGFVFASILVSSIYSGLGPGVGEAMITDGVIKGWTKIGRGWFFCLAFVSIGLATDFRELGHYFHKGKPLILYLCGQTLNLILTLAMAYLMFFIVFPEITAQI
ncbi:YeiH family protein [Nitrospina sp. 32_T5]|uniref:YeiH family protein n=1 Tax=unclassified Nitrospina TaxID=2638683 RepID=UPI003F9AA169